MAFTSRARRWPNMPKYHDNDVSLPLLFPALRDCIVGPLGVLCTHSLDGAVHTTPTTLKFVQLCTVVSAHVESKSHAKKHKILQRQTVIYETTEERHHMYQNSIAADQKAAWRHSNLWKMKITHLLACHDFLRPEINIQDIMEDVSLSHQPR